MRHTALCGQPPRPKGHPVAEGHETGARGVVLADVPDVPFDRNVNFDILKRYRYLDW